MSRNFPHPQHVARLVLPRGQAWPGDHRIDQVAEVDIGRHSHGYGDRVMTLFANTPASLELTIDAAEELARSRGLGPVTAVRTDTEWQDALRAMGAELTQRVQS